MILGNMLLPGMLDRYLAGAAFKGQETWLPILPGRRDNLMTPVHDLHRTRGSFGSEARNSALVTIGPIARLAPVVAGALAFFAVGILAHRLWRKQSTGFQMR